MIEAMFDTSRSRRAAIAGVYQYDTGQRLRLRGLPTPQAFTGGDALLSGTLAAVQAQFANEGDSQAQTRLCVWEEAQDAWVCEIPDEVLTRAQPVHVYVYVTHGETESQTRARTMYEGVFTPIGRPAPHNVATPEQWADWGVLLGEIELALTSAQTATESAQEAAPATMAVADALYAPTAQASGAAQRAIEARGALLALKEDWKRLRITRTDLPPGGEATIAATQDAGAPMITLGIPRGADGKDGEKGDTGPADVSFLLDGTTLITTTR